MSYDISEDVDNFCPVFGEYKSCYDCIWGGGIGPCRAQKVQISVDTLVEKIKEALNIQHFTVAVADSFEDWEDNNTHTF